MLVRLSLALALLAAVLAAPAMAGPTISERLAPGQPPLVIAQRALGGGAPENSLAGIRHAMATGTEMVRIDIQLTRDDRYVLMHDPTLNRTTDVESVYPEGPPDGPDRTARGGRDYVRDYTLDQLRALHLTDGQDGGEHPVATLDEALDLMDGRILGMIGLKAYEVDSLAPLLLSRDTGHLAFFDIFYSDPTLMRDISAATGIPVVVAISESRDRLRDLGRLAESLGPALVMVVTVEKHLTPEIDRRAADLGIAICVSGVHSGEDSALLIAGDPGPWKTALATGAAAFLTVAPNEVRALLEP